MDHSQCQLKIVHVLFLFWDIRLRHIYLKIFIYRGYLTQCPQICTTHGQNQHTYCIYVLVHKQSEKGVPYENEVQGRVGQVQEGEAGAPPPPHPAPQRSFQGANILLLIIILPVVLIRSVKRHK